MSTFDSPELQRCYDVAIRGAWAHPFFLIPLGHLHWVEVEDSERVQTMAVAFGADGNPQGATLMINPEFVRSLPDSQLFGVLCHEILHPLLQHAARADGKKMESWAKATDMAINASLTQSGIDLPPYALMAPREHWDASAEELYALIEADEIESPQYDPNKATAGCMPGKGEEEAEGAAQSQAEQRFWGEMLAQCQAIEKGEGTSKAMAKLFARRPTKQKWDRLLKNSASRAAQKSGRDMQTFSRTNRRSTPDLILPGWQTQRPSVAVIIDTSGSVSDDMLAAALNSVIEVAKVSGVRFFLALHDGECYFSDWIKPDSTVKHLSSLCGQRGGTCPRGAFLAIGKARGRFDSLVYLTDGEVGEYPAKPLNTKRVIVGVLGDRKSTYRAKVPGGWTEIGVEI